MGLHDICPGLGDQFRRGRGGASGRQQVVDQGDPFSGFKGVRVDLDGRFAVFELVGDAFCLPGQLPPFADRNEADPEAVGDGCSEKKSARVDADDLLNLLSRAIRDETINGKAQKDPIAQDRRDVLEENSSFWKIGDVAHGRAKGIGLAH